jgi:glycosyltransferase involved in cell wall biosynthesis
MNNKAHISVILPVFNGETTLYESIESILQQDYQNFELIIINDGSTDNSLKIASGFADHRIRIYSTENQGLPKSLNLGISLANSELIARQDQDDISYPSRLRKQKMEFEIDRNLVLCGTNAYISNQFGQIITQSKIVSRNDDLKYVLMFKNPFYHSSVMFKKNIKNIKVNYSIDPDTQPPEDYELWTRLSEEGNFYCIKEPLINYRISKTSLSRKKSQTISQNLRKISTKMINKKLNLNSVESEYIYNYYYKIENASANKFRVLSRFMYANFCYFRKFDVSLASWLEFFKTCTKILLR